jgi:hypothetical protein
LVDEERVDIEPCSIEAEDSEMSQSEVEGSVRSKSRGDRKTRSEPNDGEVEKNIVDETKQVEIKFDSDEAEYTQVPQAELECLAHISKARPVANPTTLELRRTCLMMPDKTRQARTNCVEQSTRQSGLSRSVHT